MEGLRPMARARLLGPIAAMAMAVHGPALAEHVGRPPVAYQTMPLQLSPLQVAPLQLSQASTDPVRERRRDELFLRLLKSPADVDLNLEYALISVQLGDLEGAITAYERLLAVDPRLVRVRLELGELYGRLGALDTARVYLGQVTGDPDAPQDARQRARDAQARLETSVGRSRFGGIVSLGLRYQSNANAAGDSLLMRSLGVDTLRPSASQPVRDVNLQLYGQFRHFYDLETASQARWETDAAVLATRQNRLTTLDLAVVELRSGPRLVPIDELPALDIRPHAIAGVIGLAGDLYETLPGLGLDLGLGSNDTRLELTGSYQQRRFRFDEMADQSGWESTLALKASHQIDQRQDVSLDLVWRNADTRKRFNDYNELGATLGYGVSLDAPFGLTPQSWRWLLNGSYIHAGYLAPDPAVDGATTRRDREWRAGLVTTVPLSENWAIATNLQLSKVSSTISNFTYNNLLISMNLVWGF
jgi:hypothetical protein